MKNKRVKILNLSISILYKLGLVRIANYLEHFFISIKGFYIDRFTNIKEYKINWWDEHFYNSNIQDSKTISKIIDPYSTAYHYASIRLLITKQLFNLKYKIKLKKILDVGCGSGHWIDFYHNFGVKEFCGIDVSRKVIEFLKQKYTSDNMIFIKDDVNDALEKIDMNFDLINAIGIMFHIIDDSKWEKTISEFSKHLNINGVLVVSGYFGLFNGLNVQFDKNGVNKRLRSKFIWTKILKKYGFKKIKFYKNYFAYDIKTRLPENNILIAMKD